MNTTIPTVELHPKVIDALNKGPVTETFFQVSNDGKWFMHKTIITTFRPVSVAQDLVEKAHENANNYVKEEELISSSSPTF